MTRALEQVLADWRERASALRLAVRARDAELIDKICDDFATAAEEYLRWLSEDEARLRSGWSLSRLRGQFTAWERQGHARFDEKRRRQYRMLIVPQRANTLAARERGRQAATKGET